MESRFEVIDAFMDGERVDAAALKRALSEEEGRDYLVDAWLLREGVQEDMALEAIASAAAPRARGARPWLLAAAILLCIGGGYFAGYRTGGTLAPPPPAPTGNPSAPTTVTVTPATSFPVPAPTRVIQLDFGAAPAGSGGE